MFIINDLTFYIKEKAGNCFIPQKNALFCFAFGALSVSKYLNLSAMNCSLFFCTGDTF